MLDIIYASLIGIFSGVLSGLAPGIPMLLGYFVFLPLIPQEPMPLILYAMTAMMGAQFFGSQAALYYKIPGESSSFPVLFELKNFTSPKDIYHAVQTTTYGSLVATVFALVVIFFILYTGVLTSMYLPVWIKASIFLFLLIATILAEWRWITNSIVLVMGALVSRYEEVASAIDVLPMYYFNTFLGIIIIFSTQLLFKSYEKVEFNDSTVVKKFDFNWKRWYRPIGLYSILGSLFGFIPGHGATIASHISYGWAKLRRQSAIQRVAASETANNSAILMAWIPLIIFGIPINAIEITFMQYFVMLGYELDFIHETNNIVILVSMLLISALIFSWLALTTNRIIYKWIASLLNSPVFGIIIGTLSVFMFWQGSNYTGDFIATHVAIFLPISYIIAKLRVSMVPVVIGMLLTEPMTIVAQQFLQIYIL